MIVRGPHAEVVLAAAYAAGLVLFAAALELVARYSLRRAHRYQTAGFCYRRDWDVWVCPQGAHLPLVAVDAAARVARYRAPAHVCNACAAKPRCTDSGDGRQIEQDLRPWLGTAIGQFQRGMSLAVLVLGGLIALIELARYPNPADTLVLGPLTVAVACLGGRLYASFRTAAASRSGMASPTPLRSPSARTAK